MPLNSLVISGILFGFVGLVLEIVAVATIGWLNSIQYGDFGLFNICYEGSCQSILHPPSSLLAVRGLTICGIIGAAVGLGMAIVFGLSQNRSNLIARTYKFSFIFFGFAGLMTLIGDVVYRVDTVHKLFFDIGTVGYSFYLSISGAIISKIGGTLIIRGGRLTEVVHATYQTGTA